jgi:tetratricopeptide (TPR) repeat protein
VQARRSIWILTIAVSAAVHAVVLSFLLRFSFTPRSNTAPEVFRITFQPVDAASHAVDIADVTEVESVSAPAAQAMDVPGVAVPNIPSQRLLNASPAESFAEAEQTTVANSEPAEMVSLLSDPQSAESPVDARSALRGAFEDSIERVSKPVQERPHEARIVSQGIEVEPITAKGMREVTPGGSVDIEAEAQAMEFSPEIPGMRPENPMARPKLADTVAPASGAKALRIGSRAIPSGFSASAEVRESTVQALETNDVIAAVPSAPAQSARGVLPAGELPRPPSEPSEIVDESALTQQDISQADGEMLAMRREPTRGLTPASPIKEEIIQPLPTMPVPMEEYTSTDSVERSAERSYQSGEFKESLALVQRGLRAAPRHSKLLALRNEILQILGARRNEHRVSALLDKANQQLAALRLTLPSGDNAFDTYGQILIIDPNNQQAQEGLHIIAERFESLASAKREQGNLNDGLRLVALGLDVDPNHSGLRSLRAEIQGILRVHIDRERQLKKLFAQLQRLQEEQTISRPNGDSAYEIIQSIFRIDPNNSRAKHALRQLVARYESLARGSQRAGALQQSLAFVEEALEIEPENPKLIALRKSLSAEIKAIQQAEVETQIPAGVESPRQPETAPEPKEDSQQPSMRIFGTF